jgi:hypothetical protein
VPSKALPRTLQQLLHVPIALAQQHLPAQQHTLLSHQAVEPALLVIPQLLRNAASQQLLRDDVLLLHPTADLSSYGSYGLLQFCYLCLIAAKQRAHLMHQQLLLLTSCSQIKRH